MTTIINGSSPSVTFSDGTTQSTSAVVGGRVPSSLMPTGSILQVVTTQINARYSTSSSSFAAIGPTLTITPSSTSSRILLLSNFSVDYSNYTFWTFFRNSTNVTGAAQGILTVSSTAAGNIGWFNQTLIYCDSPSTTSSISYNLAVYANSSGTVYLNDNSTTNNGQIIAMEIAG